MVEAVFGVQYVLCPLQETGSRIGENGSGGQAVEEPHSQVLLQGADVHGDGRLGQVEFRSGGGEASGTGQGGERPQQACVQERPSRLSRSPPLVEVPVELNVPIDAYRSYRWDLL